MVEITDLDVNLVIMQHARPHSRTFLTDWPHNRLHNRTARSMVAWASSSPYAWRAARTVQITYTKSCSVSLCNLLLFTNMVTSLTTPYGSHSPGVQAPPLLPCGSRTSLQSLETRHSATSLGHELAHGRWHRVAGIALPPADANTFSSCPCLCKVLEKR